MNSPGLTRLRGRSLLLLGLLAFSAMAVSTSSLLGANAVGGAVGIASGSAFGSDPQPHGICQLYGPGGRVQHVIYIQFDNLHLARDNPNVPSDLEQMPALLNFMENNGVLFANQQTPLISHTADDILTSLTGVYPNRLGEAVANSYGYFNPSGT